MHSSENPAGTLLAGRRGLIMGVTNERSLAWGIAQSAAAQGATLGFTYAGEAIEKRVRPLAESLGSTFIEPCDVSRDAEIDTLFAEAEKHFGTLDFLVHAIAFSDKSELDGRYVDTSRANFLNTMDISSFSFTAVAARAERLMPEGGSILTLTYYGAEKVMPHYNVMGVAKAALEASVRYLAVDLGAKNIRVNAISAGPIKTLAGRGVGQMGEMLRVHAEKSPLRRNVDQLEVGSSALYLASNLSGAVTGETLYVDCGYNIMGF
jgi:enoyl-[acyl-carrier protein] reductase I